MLKFIEDVNGFELVNVYVEHCVDNPNIIDEAELGHGYDEEGQFNDGPNYDNYCVLDDELRNNKGVEESDNELDDEGGSNEGV